MRKDPIELRGGELVRQPRRHSIHPRLVTWQEVAFLAATAVVVACLVGEGEQGGKNKARQTLVGHAGTVKSLVFRPDGTMLCSVGLGGAIMLWDLAASQEYPSLCERLDQVRCAAFSPDSKLMATASPAGTVTVHDLVTRESRVLYNPPTKSTGAACLAFAPDDAMLAVGQQDGQITLWDVGTGRSRQALGSHTDFIASLAFSPDGATLASSSGDRSVRLWDLPAGRERLVLDVQNTVTVLAFSPDGRLLVLGDQISPVIRLWEMRTGCERVVPHGLAGSLVAVAISPDGTTLAAADFRGLVSFWNLPALKTSPRQLRHAGVHSLAFAPDGHTLATGGFDGTIQLWDWPDSVMTDAPRPVASSTSSIKISRVSAAHVQAGTSGANRPAALVQAAVSRGS